MWIFIQMLSASNVEFRMLSLPVNWKIVELTQQKSMAAMAEQSTLDCRVSTRRGPPPTRRVSNSCDHPSVQHLMSRSTNRPLDIFELSRYAPRRDGDPFQHIKFEIPTTHRSKISYQIDVGADYQIDVGADQMCGYSPSTSQVFSSCVHPFKRR